MIQKTRYERTAVQDILCPVNGYRGFLELQGKKPKNHMKDNLAKLKQKEEEVKRRTEEETATKAQPFKMKKFQNVQSKVLSTFEGSERPMTAASSRPKSSYGSKQVVFGRLTENNKAVFDQGDKENDQQSINFVEEESVVTESIEKHKDFGKVPSYIEKYKEEFAEIKEKKEKDQAMAKLPPGTRVMSEEERIKTLEELSRQRTDIQDFLFAMPISMKTEALKNKKREMELKIAEIERAIGTFSRKVVYVKDENAVSVAATPVPKKGKL